MERGVNVGADVYIAMPKTQYQPDIEMPYSGRENVWQRDGAPAHTARTTKNWAAENMPNAAGKWPATSPDLNAMDCYCWSQIKQLVSQQASSSRLEPIVAINTASRRLDAGAIRRTIGQFALGLEECVPEEGDHLERNV